MSFNTAAQIEQKIADILQATGVSALPAQWASTMAPDALNEAYAEIVSTLAGRGFSLTQINAWDYGAYYEERLALYYALSKGAAGQAISQELIKSFDCRERLQTVVVVGGGLLTTPAGPVGIPNSGSNSTGTDIFVWPDPGSDDDFPGPGLGDATNW